MDVTATRYYDRGRHLVHKGLMSSKSKFCENSFCSRFWFWWWNQVTTLHMSLQPSTVHGLTDCINTLRPRQNGHHFADDLFKCIFVNENVWISIKISLKFVPKGPIYNIPALVQIMAWRRLGDKPLSEPMIARLSTHICVTRPQWVKST